MPFSVNKPCLMFTPASIHLDPVGPNDTNGGNNTKVDISLLQSLSLHQ
jgi:hypothetical protein